MNKTIMTSILVLVLVIGVGIHLLSHSADARGMPKCWLKLDGTLKAKYLNHTKGTSGPIYPIPSDTTYCQYKR